MPSAALPSKAAAASPPFSYSLLIHVGACRINGVCSIISLIKFVGVVINGTKGLNAGMLFIAIAALPIWVELSSGSVQVCFIA